MEINNKYNIDDKLYCYQDGKIFYVIVKGVDISITPDRTSIMYKVDTCDHDNSEILKYHYLEENELVEDLRSISDILEVY